MGNTMSEYQLSPKRTLMSGRSEVSIRGKRGRYVFQYERNGELTFYGGVGNRVQYTTVTPDRVKVVHRKVRTRSVVARLENVPKVRTGSLV